MTTAEIKDLIIKYKKEINSGLKYFFNDTLRRGAIPMKEVDRDVFAIVLLYGVSDIYNFYVEETIREGKIISWVIQTKDDDLLWWSMTSREYYAAWINLPQTVYNWLGSLKVIQVR